MTEKLGTVATPVFVTITAKTEGAPTVAEGNAPELKVIGPAGRNVKAEFNEPNSASPVPIGADTATFVTVTPTAPLLSPIGVRAVMVRELITTTCVAGLPMVTVAPAAKPVPVMVTGCSPCLPPLAGVIDVTVGAAICTGHVSPPTE